MPCSKISCKKTLDNQITKKILQEIMATFQNIAIYLTNAIVPFCWRSLACLKEYLTK